MSETFDPLAKSLILPVRIGGPCDSFTFRFALDTGAAVTVVPAMYLRQLGVDLSRPVGHTNLRGATGIARAPLIRVPAATALDRVRPDFVVAAMACHWVPTPMACSG